ncbi:MAG: hypothetical protein HOO67_03740 [Candidatus Peribacteraceae bacterium]|nr:hypothetical protein [Candidatus Peribacteraceae bacterium]
MAHSWFRYRESVEYLRGRGAIGGYPDGTFKPAATVNRAEFLKLVFGAKGAAEPAGGDCFLDVKADAWFAPFVCAAKRRGIVEGYPTGTGSVFKPDQPVVFSEAIKMTLAAYGTEVTPAQPGEAWYEPYALELDRSGILGRHSYLPWDHLSRERAADVIARFVRHEEDRIDTSRSAGCGKPLPAPLSTVSVAGVNRTFYLTVPRDYLSHEPSPLIIAFHGRTNSNEELRSYIGLDKNAPGFFIAYPTAIRSPQGTFSWSGTVGESLDLSFFDALVESIADQYCIDMDRIFVAGHSLGAWMSNSVACLRGGVVRASASVAGDSIVADCTGPSAALLINNPHDPLSPFAAAERTRDTRLRENGCAPQSEPVQPDTLKCRLYKNCDGGNVVTWCPHELDNDPRGVYYPHNWPKEAAPAIADFFKMLK